MLDFLFLLLSGLVCVLVQGNLFLNLHVFPIKPDLTIPLAVYISISRPPLRAAASIFALGFILDSFSGGFLGLFVFAREAIFCVLCVFKKLFSFDNQIFLGLVALGFYLVEGLFFFYFLFTDYPAGVLSFLVLSLLHGLFSLFLWALVWPIYSTTQGYLAGGNPRCEF